MAFSPAEEWGLYGLRLDSRLRQVFYALPPAQVLALTDQLTATALARSFVYLREGQPEPIRAMLRPCVLLPDQLAYLHFVSLTLLNVLKRLPDLYLQDGAVRRTLPLTPPEAQWLQAYWGPNHREHNPVLGRLDAVLDFASPLWKDSLHFMEPNLSSVGGLYLTPVCEQMVLEVVVPVLAAADPTLHLEAGLDLRELFLAEALDHLAALGRRGRTLCLIEPKYAGDGPVEQAALVDYYQHHHALTVLHADPSELHLCDDEVWYENQRVDLAYRDYEIGDLLALEEEEGVDIRPMRALFQQNRIISSLAGEFDHKSCWELLTDPHFTYQYCNAEERQVFRRHVLWTRLLADRRTTLPDGENGSLLEFVRKNQDFLVIKPNRAYGGDRVILGPAVNTGEWQAAIEVAVNGTEHGAEAVPQQWVVQRLAQVPVYEFPVVAADRSVQMAPFYTVLGLAPTRYGLSILGRASQKLVVNVAQQGGLCAVLLGKMPGRAKRG